MLGGSVKHATNNALQRTSKESQGQAYKESQGQGEPGASRSQGHRSQGQAYTLYVVRDPNQSFIGQTQGVTDAPCEDLYATGTRTYRTGPLDSAAKLNQLQERAG